MRLLSLVAFALALVGASNVWAQTVGEKAPALTGVNWVMNEPANFDGNNLEGQVTLVEFWGTR